MRNPPALPMPRTAGGATTKTAPSWMTENFLISAMRIAAADCAGSLARSSNGLSLTNTAPALGALVRVAPEKPTILTAWATPGISSASSTTRRFTASVRSSDAAGGNCVTVMR